MNYAPPPPSGRSAQGALGIVSFVLGLVTVFIDVVSSLSAAFVLRAPGSTGVYSLISGITGTAVAIIGVAALVLGVVVLVQKGSPKGFAAAGVALGGQAVLFVGTSLVQGLLFSIVR